MTRLPMPFNPLDVSPEGASSPLPSGQYNVKITAIDIVDGKAAPFVKFSLSADHGDYSIILNLYHESRQTREIAASKFSAICHVVGVLNLPNNDVTPLIGRQFRVNVVDNDKKPEYPHVNILNLDGTKPKAGQRSAAPAGAFGVPSTDDDIPWG